MGDGLVRNGKAKEPQGRRTFLSEEEDLESNTNKESLELEGCCRQLDED